MLAYATYGSILMMFLVGFGKVLPGHVKVALVLAFGMANVQAASGITTVLRASPLHEALTHQMCSLMLLSTVLYALHTLRKPNKAVLRQLKLAKNVTIGGPKLTQTN